MSLRAHLYALRNVAIALAFLGVMSILANLPQPYLVWVLGIVIFGTLFYVIYTLSYTWAKAGEDDKDGDS
jgi:uncharacterized membrane protein YecN with MAPEG domain